MEPVLIRWDTPPAPPPRRSPLFLPLASLSILALLTLCSLCETRISTNQAQAKPFLGRRLNFCDETDKYTTGWAGLSDDECMARITAVKEEAAAAVRVGSGTLFFKHVHKAGGTTICQLGQKNMAAEDVSLPFRNDWSTNCVPYESFLGTHPAVSGGSAFDSRLMRGGRRLLGTWLGGACFLGFLTPAQWRAFPQHYAPLRFVASEGPLPDAIPLDTPLAMMTMLRNPLDRVVSSYRWWQFMASPDGMPHTPTECRAYTAPANATLEDWITKYYPDNWMTRELAGISVLYRRDSRGRPAPLTEADVEKAKRRLHYYAAILILERSEDSQFLLRRRFGWREVDLREHRAGSKRNSAAEEELRGQPWALATLKDVNRYDMEIYEYAVELHTEQVQQEMKEAAVERRRRRDY